MTPIPEDPVSYGVIIIGAGPAGLTLANLLGTLGVSTLVIERNSTTVKEPRAVSIDDEALRTIQACGLIATVIKTIVPGYGSRYLTPSGTCFMTVKPSGTPYGYPRRNAFRQPVFEGQLRDGLGRFDHVATLFGWTASRVLQDTEGASVEINRGAETRRITAPYIVGCDGASSLVRKELGFSLEGTTSPERWLIVDLEDSPAERDTVVFCDWNRPCIALPGPDRTRRFEFKLLDNDDEQAFRQPENVRRLLDAKGVALGSRIVRTTIYTFHARLADHWSKGRIFLAGDAAHLTPPFAGQGMNSGIRDAHNLAWKLALVLSGKFKPLLLESYELERRAHVGAMIDLALRMGRIMAPPNGIVGRAVQSAFSASRAWPALRSYFAEMKYKPRPRFRSGFLISSSHPLVGRLLPQPRVKDAQAAEMLLDYALAPGFVLLGIEVAASVLQAVCSQMRAVGAWITPALLSLSGALARSPPSSITLLTLVEAPDEALMRIGGTLLFVRPDRYVMAGFSPGESPAVARWLRAYLIDSPRAAVEACEISEGGAGI